MKKYNKFLNDLNMNTEQRKQFETYSFWFWIFGFFIGCLFATIIVI